MPISFLSLIFLSSLNLFYPLNAVYIRCLRVLHVVRPKKGGKWEAGQETKKIVRVWAKIFWRAIYGANLRPETDSQYSYLYFRGLGILYPRIIWEYDLATAIAIWLLSQSRMCKMGSSISSVMSQLKLASTTRAFFTSITSTERTKREEHFCWSWQ